MFLQSIPILVDDGCITGRDISVLMLASKKFHTHLRQYANSFAVNEMYKALLERVRRIHPYSEIHVSSNSFTSIHRDTGLITVNFVVSRNITDRKIKVFCHFNESAYVTNVRPSVFNDPDAMAENLLAVNRLCSTLSLNVVEDTDIHYMGGGLYHCISRTTSSHMFTALLNIEHGSVELHCNMGRTLYDMTVYPTISRVLMAPPFTGRLVFNNLRSGYRMETLFSVPRALYIHGLVSNIERGFGFAAQQTME